eukprot:1158701-Pelagomonas_calceolata.AAC.11
MRTCHGRCAARKAAAHCALPCIHSSRSNIEHSTTQTESHPVRFTKQKKEAMAGVQPSKQQHAAHHPVYVPGAQARSTEPLKQTHSGTNQKKSKRPCAPVMAGVQPTRQQLAAGGSTSGSLLCALEL